MTTLPTYVLERVFNAPRKLVWRTWTEPTLLARWYGPNVETIIHQLDVRPGGLWLNEMKMGGGSYYQRWNTQKWRGAGMKVLEELLAELQS